MSDFERQPPPQTDPPLSYSAQACHTPRGSLHREPGQTLAGKFAMRIGKKFVNFAKKAGTPKGAPP